MSERAYLFSRLSKGLPRALADIPKGAEMTNPFVFTRVAAHDRGKAAGRLVASGRKAERKVPPPVTKKQFLVHPPKAARDWTFRQERLHDVNLSREAAARVRGQGKWARKMSRQQIGVAA